MGLLFKCSGFVVFLDHIPHEITRFNETVPRYHVEGSNRVF